MPRSTTAKPAARAKRRAGYHHGNLREAMIEATVALVAEVGAENVTVREVARRAGVSSGAPFRHFPNKTALMTAVAEEATRRLRVAIETAVAQVDGGDPLARISAIGRGYFDWALRHPTHFAVVAARKLIDYDGSPTLARDNAVTQTILRDALAEAQRRGLIDPADLHLLDLEARALAYGLARMHVDGHLPQWGVAPGEVEATLRAVLDRYLGRLIAGAPEAGPPAAGPARPAAAKRRR